MVDDCEEGYCVELFHGLKSLLLDLDLDMIVNLFLKEARKFKLYVVLQTVVFPDYIVLPLRDFRSQRNVIHW